MQTTTSYRTLPVKLSEAEVAKRADELAAKELQEEQVKAEKKNAVASFTGRLSLLRESIGKLSRAVDTRTEGQEVVCEEVWDDERFEVRTIRTDTEEVLHERPFTPSERQEAIDRKQETLPFELDPEEPHQANGKAKAAPAEITHRGQTLTNTKTAKKAKAKGPRS